MNKYFDIQVNGYAGVDFNSKKLTYEQLYFACEKLVDDNVKGIFATIITDDIENMNFKIRNLASIIEKSEFIKSIVKGIHVEGPFLNSEKGYRGAHPEKFIIPGNLDIIKELIDSGRGMIKLVTLAPEIDDRFELTKYLTRNNIVVSAGHTNATLEQLSGCINNGLKMFTHLGNGSPSILPRHDNIINRVLSLSDQLYICFIADGIHIPIFALKNYLKMIDLNKCIIVTDSMAAASAPPGKYSVSHIEVQVGDDRIVREVGKKNLAGSAITMKESEEMLKTNIKLNKNELINILYFNIKKLFNNKFII